ncbi:hypothetical protein D3C73_1049660 [compost metagenome]
MGEKRAPALVVTYGDCSGLQPIFAIEFLPIYKCNRTQSQQGLEPHTQFTPYAPNVTRSTESSFW